MFGFLKKKLKEAISGFSKKVEEESKPEEVEENKIEENKVEKRKAEEKINEEVKKEDNKEREEEKAVKKDKGEEEEVEENKEEEKERESAGRKEEVNGKENKVKNSERKEKKEKSLERKEKVEKKSEAEEKLGEEKIKNKKEKENKEEVVVGEESVEEEGEQELEVEKKEEDKIERKEKSKGKKEEHKGFFSGIKRVFSHHEKGEVEEAELEKNEISEKESEVEPVESQPKSFAQKIKEVIVKKTLTEEEFDKLFWDVEVVLLQNNVALEVIEKIKSDLRGELVNKKVFRKGIPKVIEDTLRRSVEEILSFEKPDILKLIKSKKEKPFVILFLGINGSGKTTTVAKLANFIKKNGFSCVMAAGDTFRAAAIQQLEEHSKNLGIKIIKQDYGSDSAAVAYDAIQYAKAHNVDVVLIDTAGRLHSNKNLMEELKKIVRVTKPDMKIFVGESVTGNDCVEQAKAFNEQIGIDSIILTKADVDDKGGAALSIAYVTKKPIIFIGTGQTYDDFKPFDPQEIVKSLFAD